MDTPITIVVTTRAMKIVPAPKSHKTRVLKETRPRATAKARIAMRFSAEFVGGPHHGEKVHGFTSEDAAIFALVRLAAGAYETATEVLDFVSGLFGRDPRRSVGEHFAYVLRSSPKRKRVRRGCVVELPVPAVVPNPAVAANTPKLYPGAPIAPEKGGAA